MSAKKSLRRETLEVKGMHCRSCVKGIEEELSSLEGVEKVSVSLSDETASVMYDSSRIGIEEIKSGVRSLGFSVDGVGGKSDTTLLQGIGYALLPHTGCIAFIAGSILGVTFLMEFFRPLLMNRWFFHILIAISMGFATLSSMLYLRKQGLLSVAGAKRKWQYLSTMYGSTIGINLVLFLLVFPLLANVQTVSATGAAVAAAGGVLDLGDSILSMSVDIPCPGHAPLISEELKTVQGVKAVTFSFPNVFDVSYDSSETTEAQMLSLEVFDEYPATVISDGAATEGELQEVTANGPSAGEYGVCDGSCGCGGR